MNHATIKDIKRATPQLGTLVVVNGGIEIVYTKGTGAMCSGCVFGRGEPSDLGAKCRDVWCDAEKGDVYLPKMKYLELKLMGEIT